MFRCKLSASNRAWTSATMQHVSHACRQTSSSTSLAAVAAAAASSSSSSSSLRLQTVSTSSRSSTSLSSVLKSSSSLATQPQSFKATQAPLHTHASVHSSSPSSSSSSPFPASSTDSTSVSAFVPASGVPIRVSELRASYLHYFQSNHHHVLPSSSLLPGASDTSLLFVNAGMVPLKDKITGRETSEHTQLTSVQKCIRAGGKHNDLDNVGYVSLTVQQTPNTKQQAVAPHQASCLTLFELMSCHRPRDR